MTTSDTPEKPTLQQNIAWYLTLLLIIMVACMPGVLCSLYYLSTVPDITWQRGTDDLTVDRIWIERIRGPVGIGYETQRIKERLSDDEVCIKTTIRYYLWRTSRRDPVEGATYHQIHAKTQYGWQSTGQPCD